MWSSPSSTPATAGSRRPWNSSGRRSGSSAGIDDRRGLAWARFLQCTLLPLLSREGAAEARERLARLADDVYVGRDLDLQEYAEAYALLLERGVEPGTPWEAWRLGMVPSRGARMVMAVPVDRAVEG